MYTSLCAFATFSIVFQLSVCEELVISTSQKVDANFEKLQPVSRITPGSDPYLYACSSNSQCTNGFDGTCHMTPSNQPNAWFCNCIWNYMSGAAYPCNRNEMCCTNICSNGFCTVTGGTQGTVCGTGPYQNSCASGYICQHFGDFGYCNKQ